MQEPSRNHILNHKLNSRLQLIVRRQKERGREGNGVVDKAERNFQAGTGPVQKGKLHSQKITPKLQRYPFTYPRLHHSALTKSQNLAPATDPFHG